MKFISWLISLFRPKVRKTNPSASIATARLIADIEFKQSIFENKLITQLDMNRVPLIGDDVEIKAFVSLFIRNEDDWTNPLQRFVVIYPKLFVTKKLCRALHASGLMTRRSIGSEIVYESNVFTYESLIKVMHEVKNACVADVDLDRYIEELMSEEDVNYV